MMKMMFTVGNPYTFPAFDNVILVTSVTYFLEPSDLYSITEENSKY